MSLMSPAPSAMVFSSRYDKFEVALLLDVSLNGLREARPASTTVKLRRGVEERQTARGTDKRSHPLFVVEAM